MCKEKRANVWCAKVFMGAGLLYNITLLDTDKKSCNCVRFDKLTRTTESYIKPSTTRRGGTPDKVCTICCFISFFSIYKTKKCILFIFSKIKNFIWRKDLKKIYKGKSQITNKCTLFK